MSLIGKYVDTFDEATHALPDGMHMNADYPFKLPAIVARDADSVTLQGRNGETVTVPIQEYRGKPCCYVEQSSTYEMIFRQPPHRFRCWPFREDSDRD